MKLSKLLLSVIPLLSGTISAQESPADDLTCFCHEIHGVAPVGVMGDHLHPAGGGMISYRFQYQRSEGLRSGTNGLSIMEALETPAPFGHTYSAVPLSMDMYMHMFEVMYAPTDWLTLMVMPMYMEMDMEMFAMGGGMGGHGEHGGHEMMDDHDDHGGHGGHGGTGGGGMRHSHGTAGWGDTLLSATFRVWQNANHSVLFNAGLSIPTGSVDEKMGGMFTHYMMQLGSGTWDAKPMLVYTGHAGSFSWGAQIGGTIRLQETNDSGYSLGDVFETTAWGSVRLADWCSVSARGLWRDEGAIEEHYNGPHRHGSPPDFQPNYGGKTLDVGLGLNLLVPSGPLQGLRGSVEVLVPVYQDVNGIQLERDYTVWAGISWSF